ncbi:hypothetical protein DIPPA_70061 [Diplonema papillatum]|nr:hypothetical protein DIPPA_70061 [Diplonema papillatum]
MKASETLLRWIQKQRLRAAIFGPPRSAHSCSR